VFVIGGALTAPRHRAATAILLAVIGVLLSLLIHVVGQHLAGNRVGSINYVQFLAESMGLLSGLAFVVWHDARAKRG
jgi:hypothetical protein